MKVADIRRHLAYAAFPLIALYILNFIYAIASRQEGGTFGDTFGAVNALFSGSALYFLIQAFLLQRDELQVVREERDDTRRLLSGQENITRLQKDALERQRFEQSFYSLLGLISEERRALNLLSHPNGSVTFIDQGRSGGIDYLRRAAAISKDDEERLRSLDANFAHRLIDCGRFCRLVTAAVELLRSYDNPTLELSIYKSALSAMLDPQIAQAWAALCIVWRRSDPACAQAFLELDGTLLLPPDIQSWFPDRVKAFE